MTLMTDPRTALKNMLHIHGFHREALEFIDDMVKTGKEPVGAMGNDTAPAVFSDKRRPITDFKKQNFAQITNPSIHPYTEADVMSLDTVLGTFEGIDGDKADKAILNSPIISKATLDTLGKKYDIVEIDCTFDASGDFETLQHRKEEIKAQALEAAKAGKHILLTNEHADENKVPFEMDMIGPAVHLHLQDEGVRGQTALHARAMEAHTTHDFACLVGSGFNTVNPYLAEHAIAQRHVDGHYGDMPLEQCFQSYFKGADAGLLAIMAKMGICTVEAYRGAFQFEAFGLGPQYIEEFAPGVHSEIGGFELEDIYVRLMRFHAEACDAIAEQKRFPNRGIHTISLAEEGEDHANTAVYIQTLQDATKANDLGLFLECAAEKRAFNIAHPTQVRDLMDVQYIKDPSEVTEADLEGVQSVEEIVSQLGVASMSFGSTSPEQHADTEEGARMAGAKWQSGEGGLPTDRKKNKWRGKGIQIASGRFGIDIEVIAYADEIEIKIAQAAKGGEGGQLPGKKVNEEIADARNVEPGTPLYSMGAHASIKSIEDLGQLVFGLKEANPNARVAAKLVAAAGIDTIMVGAIKDLADRVHISGTGGGTGAAKKTSQQHTSMPWEIYLPKAHKMATEQGFRERVVFSADGGMSTPQDVVIATMLGAEEIYFGKSVMYVLGCRNMGVCNKNTCAPGNATMDPELRKNYTGKPEYVANYFTMMAEGVRRELAALGVKSLDELRGKVEKLKYARLLDRNFDFSNQLIPFEGNNTKCTLKRGERNEYINPRDPEGISLDERLYRKHGAAILDPLPWDSDTLHVTNENRNIGTRLSYYLQTEFEGATCDDHSVTLNLEGVGAGQQMGFMLAKGITIKLDGRANDGVGEGNSGGIIVARPKPGTRIFEHSHTNSIVGNHAGYGMTAGEMYLMGVTGTNHGFRYSGGVTVSEGLGANAYRFMTGGVGICLGRFGPGLAAGAGGGTLIMYDPRNELEDRIDQPMRPAIQHLEDVPEHRETLLSAMKKCHEYTGSNWVDRLLQQFDDAANDFKVVSPRLLNPSPSTPPAVQLTIGGS